MYVFLFIEQPLSKLTQFNNQPYFTVQNYKNNCYTFLYFFMRYDKAKGFFTLYTFLLDNMMKPKVYLLYFFYKII